MLEKCNLDAEHACGIWPMGRQEDRAAKVLAVEERLAEDVVVE